MEKNTITRIGYCELCANNHNPKVGQQFLAFGSSSNEFHVMEAERTSRHFGYVPHMYKLDKVNGTEVIVLKSCAMYPCGCDRRLESSKRQQYWFYFIKTWKREVWTLETWNALVMLKHNQFTKEYEI